jgi:hypothetical protein
MVLIRMIARNHIRITPVILRIPGLPPSAAIIDRDDHMLPALQIRDPYLRPPTM